MVCARNARKKWSSRGGRSPDHPPAHPQHLTIPHAGLRVVPSALPSSGLGAHLFYCVDPPIQTLSVEHVDLDLGDVEPAAVLGSVDEFEAVPERLGRGWGKCLVE